MRWNELENECCSVARTLAVIGDRWTLMVLRDCFLGIRRFEDFQTRLGVTRHVLADRLKKLVQHDVLERRQYQDRPARFEYRLTDKGLELHAVMLMLIHWGDRHMSDGAGPPVTVVDRTDGHVIEPVLVDRVTGREITARSVRSVSKNAASRRGAG